MKRICGVFFILIDTCFSCFQLMTYFKLFTLSLSKHSGLKNNMVLCFSTTDYQSKSSKFQCVYVCSWLHRLIREICSVNIARVSVISVW